jgi:subtilisin family serine protease
MQKIMALVSILASSVFGERPAENGWIVLFKQDVAMEDFRSAMTDLRTQYRQQFTVEHLFDANPGMLGFHGHFSDELALTLKNTNKWNSLIDIVEKNSIVTLAQSNPVEVQTNVESWGIDRVDQVNLPLNQTYYYDSNGGEGVKVFILDTGIFMEHADFEGRAVFGRNFETIDPGITDYHGHGSHVAGIVGGKTFGVSKKVSLISAKCLSGDGAGWMSEVTRAMDWVLSEYRADSNKKYIANLSVQSLQQGASLDRSISTAAQAGVIVVVAGGNNSPIGRDACTSSPGKNPDAISVGATDVDDSYAEWSNYGRCITIIAPGRQITSVGGTGNNRPPTDPNGVRVMSGTSQASPFVVGAAAIKYHYKSYTPDEMRQALIDDATQGIVTGAPGTTPNLFLHINPFKPVQ